MVHNYIWWGCKCLYISFWLLNPIRRKTLKTLGTRPYRNMHRLMVGESIISIWSRFEKWKYTRFLTSFISFGCSYISQTELKINEKPLRLLLLIAIRVFHVGLNWSIRNDSIVHADTTSSIRSYINRVLLSMSVYRKPCPVNPWTGLGIIWIYIQYNS